MAVAKGPYWVEGHDIKCNPTEDDTGTHIAEMISSRSISETKENAKLLAGSWDMRRMLEENLAAWDGEEESVKEEHRELIEETRALLASLPAD